MADNEPQVPGVLYHEGLSAARRLGDVLKLLERVPAILTEVAAIGGNDAEYIDGQLRPAYEAVLNLTATQRVTVEE